RNEVPPAPRKPQRSDTREPPRPPVSQSPLLAPFDRWPHFFQAKNSRATITAQTIRHFGSMLGEMLPGEPTDDADYQPLDHVSLLSSPKGPAPPEAPVCHGPRQPSAPRRESPARGRRPDREPPSARAGTAAPSPTAPARTPAPLEWKSAPRVTPGPPRAALSRILRSCPPRRWRRCRPWSAAG